MPATSATLGPAVLDLVEGSVLRPGSTTSLTERERTFLQRLVEQGHVPTGSGREAHSLKQVVYRLKRKLPDGVLVTGRGRYEARPQRHDPDVVGRLHERRAAEHALHHSGAVQLVGPGGAGKSRLARTMADELEMDFEVVWVDAHRLSTLEELTTQIAQALSLSSSDHLLGSLASRPATAVVLDNLEGVTGVEEGVAAWREASSEHRWVLTTRSEVQDVAVARLSVLGASAAEELFVRRGGQLTHTGSLLGVDALPLVVELLAAASRDGRRPRDASPLDARIEGRREDSSLRQALEGAWDGLSPQAQQVLANLVVFAGSFSGADATEVVQASQAVLDELVRASLLDRRGTRYRLLEVVRQYVHEGDLPYGRHAAWTVRRGRGWVDALDAAERAAAVAGLTGLADDLQQVIRGPHTSDLDRAAGLVVRAAMTLQGPFPAPSLDVFHAMLEVELPDGLHDEIALKLTDLELRFGDIGTARATLDKERGESFDGAMLMARLSTREDSPTDAMAVLDGAFEKASDVQQRGRAMSLKVRLHQLLGSRGEAERLGRELLQMPLNPGLAMTARMRLALQLQYGPKHEESIRILEDARDLADAWEDQVRAQQARINLGISQYTWGLYDEAEQTWSELQTLAARFGSRLAVFRAKLLRGQVALDRGDLVACEALVPPPTERPRLEIGRLAAVAALRTAQRRVTEAISVLEQALAMSRDIGQPALTGYVSIQLAFAVAGEGDVDRAEELLEQSKDVARQAAYLGLIADLARDRCTLVRAPTRAARVARSARAFDKPGVHPEVRRAARIVLDDCGSDEGREPIVPSPSQEGAPPVRQGVFTELVLGAIRVDLANGRAVRDGQSLDLTQYELGVLRALALGRGEPVSRQDLLTEVWGYSPKAKTRAVDQTVYRLRKKLEDDPKSPRFLRSVHRRGYVLSTDQGAE